MILKERFDRANLLWHFHQKKTQDKQLIESYLSLMSIPETSFHAETGKGSTWTSLPSFCFLRMTWHQKRQLVICSPPRHSSMAATALGSATGTIIGCLHGGAGPQQQRDHLDVALQRCQMQRRSASGRRPRGSPHGSRRERTRLGKLASCASCASLKS